MLWSRWKISSVCQINFYLESYQHFYQRAIKAAIKCGFTDPLETTKHDLTDVTQPSWLETITLHDTPHLSDTKLVKPEIYPSIILPSLIAYPD